MNEQMAENKAKRFTPHGSDLFGEAVQKKHTSKLGDEFLIPPFSVLSAREGDGMRPAASCNAANDNGAGE